MANTRILAIAPYEGLKEVLLNEAAKRGEEIELKVYVGDLANGLDIARSLLDKGFDVILSRGGTAELLEQNLPLPVVDVVPSVFDVLRFVRLARNMPSRHAIVAFPAIANIAAKLFDLVGQSEEIHTIHNAREAGETIACLKEAGCELIVGDAIAVTTAQWHKMNAILIASGAESVQAAFTEAVRLHTAVERVQAHNLMFRAVLDQSKLNVVVFNAEKKLVYSNLSSDQMDYPRVFRTISECVPAAIEQGEISIARKSKGFVWSITGRRMVHGSDDHAVFYVERRLSLPQSKAGVVEYYHMLNDNEATEDGMIDSVGVMRGVQEDAARLGATLAPVLVTGEAGTPVDSLLRTLYMSSPWSMHTLMSADCAVMDAKSFRWLLECEDSPLCENQLNICLRNIDALPEALRLSFIDFARNTKLHKRDRVLYSAKGALPDDIAAFLNESGCAMLRLPSLRERREDIPSLANLCLGVLNAELGQQTLGFTPEALALMTEYSWPGNHDQLRRVIRQALMSHSGELIDDARIRGALAGELSSAAAREGGVALEGTLDDITARVVRAVLMQEGMNRTRTVERLGISRSTLWRMLK